MMRTRLTLRNGMILFTALALLLIIGLGQAVPSPVQAVGTPELNKDWKLSAKHSSETSTTPAYNLKINQPVLETSDTSGDAFNKAVNDIIAKTVSDFKDASKTAVTGPGGPGSTSALEIWYDIYVTDTDIISTQFRIYTYIAGAAHPLTVSHTLNYNIATGAEVTLASLFNPNSNYLDAISKYCIAQLKPLHRLSFPDGAAAKPENYVNWTIDRSGLLIIFDPYQVGPYVQGPSTVLVPFDALSTILADHAPIPYFG